MSRIHLYKFPAIKPILAGSLIVVSVAAQSVIDTFNFSPPGVTNNVGFDFRVAVVNSTGLVYVGTTGAYGDDVGVIDPATNTVAQVISLPTSGTLNFARVNQATGMVYFRQPNSNIVVVDGRPSSSTFNQALPSLTLSGRVIQSFALDESRGLLFVTNNTTSPAQSRVRIIDVNPASSTFHQALNEVSMPANAFARGVAVNQATNKIYIAATGPGVGGVYVLNGATLSLALIPGTGGAFGVAVNESSNLVYATAPGNLLRAIDGAAGTALAAIPMPGLISVTPHERIALHTGTGRVYVRTSDTTTPAKLVVVDGDRLSPTFNTVLAAIDVGRTGGNVVVDEGLNRILTHSQVDKKTSIIDGGTNTTIATIASKQSPSDVAIDPLNHRAYVANQLNFVQEIDVAGAMLAATILTGAEAGPGVVNPNNHLFYTTRTVETTDLPVFNKCGIAGVVAGQPHDSGRYLFPVVNRITNRVYVENAGANLTGDSGAGPGFVSVIDGSTNSVTANVPVGDQPFGAAVNELTNRIYVLNAGLLAPGSISVIDGLTNTAIFADTSALGPQAGFAGDVVVNETTNKAYFQVNGLPGAIGVLNGATDVASPLPASLGPVSIIRVNKILNRIYVGTSSGLLRVLDGATDALITTLTVGSSSPDGRRPIFIAVNELTGQLFVSDLNNDIVRVIDGATNSIIATIAVGDGPAGVAVNELTNHAYVGNVKENTISFIDAESLAVESTLGVSLLPGRLEIDPAVSRVYVSTGDAPLQSGIAIVSDSAGTLHTLRQATVAATAGDPPGIRSSMLAKVERAKTAFDRGNGQAAINDLHALENEIEAQRGKTLTSAEADHLRALISAAVNSVC